MMFLCFLFFSLLAKPVFATGSSAATTLTPLTGLVQVLLGLGLVIGGIMLARWIFQRLTGGLVRVPPRHLRVISGVMVGPRERVVIVECADQWLVVGVSAHSVNLLASHSKPEIAEHLAPTSTSSAPFTRWFKAALDKHRTTA